MVIPSSLPSGKEAALYSVYKYVQARFAEISPAPSRPVNFIDIGQEQTRPYPTISMQDFGAPQEADWAIGRDVAVGKKGRQEVTSVEFNILDANTVTVTDAERNVRRLRDQLKYCIQEEGMTGPTGALILPDIPFVDPNNSDASTGSRVWHPREEAGSWIESFIADQPATPNEKRYRIFCRFKWLWLEA